MRTRVVAAMLGMATLAMTVAGATSYVVERERVDTRIDADLAQEVEELRTFAAGGIDPDTGLPFASVERLMFVALQRNVPDSSEGLMTLVDGEIYLVPSADVSVRLEDDAEFVRVVTEIPPDGHVRARTLDTTEGSLRYLAVPVRVEGDVARGLYVIAYSRDLELAPVNGSYRTYALVALASLLVVGVVGWAVTGRLLRPIRLLRETAQRISDENLSGRIPVTGRDDVSELARTVNAMLDRLEAAFAGHREALDDAGHELRTPITIIRGHLELMDAGDPADVEETRALALDEVDRMRRLVDDLVVLARARRPDFVRRGPADLGVLIDDVLDKARPLAPRRWTVESRVEATADLDEQRITQALLQLVSNAVRFTDDDDVIALGAAIGPAGVRLWVRDTGAGIPADQVGHVFERFHRVSGGRGEDGSGLGLAIVKAIAEAHHGGVDVTSIFGGGSVFSITIPQVDAATTTELDQGSMLGSILGGSGGG